MLKEYRVEVKTGNRNNAGTDANVAIQLIGSKGKSPELELDNERDNFERNALDTFLVRTEDVGWIDEIRLFHDNSGSDEGWYVEYVKVTDQSRSLCWQADLYRWLADDEGDHSIDVTTPIPIGTVSLDKGVLKSLYLGYSVARHSNPTTTAQVWHTRIGYRYQTGTSVNVQNSTTVSASLELGFSFFGVSSKFVSSITTSVSKQLGSTSAESFEADYTVDLTLDGGHDVTVVTLFYQDVLSGAAMCSGVRIDYDQKFMLNISNYTFEGLLSDADVQQRVRDLIADMTDEPVTGPVPKTGARLPLFKRDIAHPDAASVASARKELPRPLPRHPERFPGMHARTSGRPRIRRLP